MDRTYPWQSYLLLGFLALTLTACTEQLSQPMPDSYGGLPTYHGEAPYSQSFNEEKYASLLPQTIPNKEKVILVDPKVFAWGAYDKGHLVRAGIASAGANYCPDEGGPCRTDPGTFRIFKLGDVSCVSHKYPIGGGGSLMPYCMFFNGGQSLHGTPDQMMGEEHASHGCIRMRIPDAEWIRYNFARVGTKVVVLPY
jgi:hypothetical protein